MRALPSELHGVFGPDRGRVTDLRSLPDPLKPRDLVLPVEDFHRGQVHAHEEVEGGGGRGQPVRSGVAVGRVVLDRDGECTIVAVDEAGGAVADRVALGLLAGNTMPMATTVPTWNMISPNPHNRWSRGRKRTRSDIASRYIVPLKSAHPNTGRSTRKSPISVSRPVASRFSPMMRENPVRLNPLTPRIEQRQGGEVDLPDTGERVEEQDGHLAEHQYLDEEPSLLVRRTGPPGETVSGEQHEKHAHPQPRVEAMADLAEGIDERHVLQQAERVGEAGDPELGHGCSSQGSERVQQENRRDAGPIPHRVDPAGRPQFADDVALPERRPPRHRTAPSTPG